MDASMRSFIPVDETSDFPIQNLPYGIFRDNTNTSPRVGVAIGDYVLDLSILEAAGKFSESSFNGMNVFSEYTLNTFMALGKKAWSEARETISVLLRDDNPELRDDHELRRKALFKMTEVELLLPVDVSEFTDFYSSFHHAFNVGSMIRGPENAIMPNWKHLPVAYHGRASSVVLSGVDIHRPQGQIKSVDGDFPEFNPTKRLDYELEMGFFIGPGNKLGEPISVNSAKDHIFGMVLVNDWSARDIQVWEYRPLGPFLSKNFATSISPWVVTLEALEPFRVEGAVQDPVPLPYLQNKEPMSYDINLYVSIQSEKMDNSVILTESNATNLYWNIAQQLAHHTITGCNTQTGDLIASGTISGEDQIARGCLLELSKLGKNPIPLSENESRTFVEDGDTIVMSGYCQGQGYRVGFGEVKTRILSAIPLGY